MIRGGCHAGREAAHERTRQNGGPTMAPKAIISYDDTVNDLDALALGRLLATAGIDQPIRLWA